MAKSENQKLKLLYIYKILCEETDENHCISTKDLISRLERYSIKAERKSIYDDIQSLIDFGYAIEKNNRKTDGGYYLKKRDFETAELKLMADAISASKFITKEQSKKLIDKLEKMACIHDAKKIKRQVFVANRIKTSNESVFDNADVIHNAIALNNQISFRYFEWTIDKKMQFRKNGGRYVVSPWAVTINAENYYLIAYDAENEMIKHYRIDKMKDIEAVDDKRQGKDFFVSFDVADYANKQFGMFSGEEQPVTIQFPNHLIGVVLDRFGTQVVTRQRDDAHFSVRANLQVSPQLFGWLAGMGSDVKILMPESVKNEYKTYLMNIIENSD